MVTPSSKHWDHHHCDQDYHGVACVIGSIGRVSGTMPGAGLPCLVCVGGLWGFRVGSYRVCEGRRRRGEGERLGLGEGCGEVEFEEEVEEEEHGEEPKELLRERVRVGWDEIWHTLHVSCVINGEVCPSNNNIQIVFAPGPLWRRWCLFHPSRCCLTSPEISNW